VPKRWLASALRPGNTGLTTGPIDQATQEILLKSPALRSGPPARDRTNFIWDILDLNARHDAIAWRSKRSRASDGQSDGAAVVAEGRHCLKVTRAHGQVLDRPSDAEPTLRAVRSQSLGRKRGIRRR
jgi:hypothetical protein